MLLPLLMAFAPLVSLGTHDQVGRTEDGHVLVMRTIDWELPSGHVEPVVVLWLLQQDGNLRYALDRQLPATQEVHRRACAQQGLAPADGIAVIPPGTPHAYHCSSRAAGAPLVN
ncbi:hypothetical protein [Stenotrophomonas tuberculopleuritidis]|uniref:hypothetical protein n=1 Tax=Stenotrophomonas tuberculopleuritidis TaxID=3055079 RepID=UPI0026E55EF9|nr:hypothetical protein [Stenotrophomonas sp. 704A1]